MSNPHLHTAAINDASVSLLNEEHQRAIIAEHLPAGYGATTDTAVASTNAGPTSPDVSQSAATEESSLLLHGGDIHRSLFKLNARALEGPRLARSKTFSAPAPVNELAPDGEGSLADQMLQPQGFRRQFVRQQHHRRRDGHKMPGTRSFAEFLHLYGSFAGEDLSDSEDDDGTEDDEESAVAEEGMLSAERPLLRRNKSTRHAERPGDAGIMKTFFTTLKAFVGTGIMFLPKAFKNGGIVFSSVTLVFVAAISMVAFHLLLQCRARHPGGYGEIGRELGGPILRALILGSITLSQLGFVCTGLVFVADNVLSVIKAVTHDPNALDPKVLIAVQAIFVIPLSFIRNISKLGPAALLADVFIVMGVVYIWSYDISSLAQHGIHPTVELFNPLAYTLTVGSAIFTFEGIGLILPIQASMEQPEYFESILGVVMVIITVIFTGVGALCYATFGDKTRIEVIDNFPQSSKLVNVIQFLYAMAVLVGNPVQLFPAMRIIESKIFGRHRSGKRDLRLKWKKNAFRSALVIFCVAVAIGGSENLDRFVALIGSFACVPLVYVYPPYLHYRGVATTRWAKLGDVALMVLGLAGMIFTTAITIAASFM